MGLFSALAHDQFKTEEVYVGSVVPNWNPHPKKIPQNATSFDTFLKRNADGMKRKHLSRDYSSLNHF